MNVDTVRPPAMRLRDARQKKEPRTSSWDAILRACARIFLTFRKEDPFRDIEYDVPFSTPPPPPPAEHKVHWSEVKMWSSADHKPLSEILRHITLSIYKDRGRPTNVIFDDPARYDASGYALDGSGRRIEDMGPQVHDIDWGGFRSFFSTSF